MARLLAVVVLPLVLVGVGLWVVFSGDEETEVRSVPVTRGTVIQHAVATGRIEPRFEVPVTSRSGGVLTRRFVALGQKVARDAPLVEVRPVVTELDMLNAERALRGAEESVETVEEFRLGKNLMGWFLRGLQGGDAIERMRRAAERGRSDAQERLQLVRDGKAEIGGKVIDYIVHAPIEGHVIELAAEVGEPVVPASSFGSGSPLLVLADLDDPVFRGSVNEIDAGRLVEAMRARLEIGALPGSAVNAEVEEISLRSRLQNNATVFDVKLRVHWPADLVLRSGYSAVARIEVARADDVLTLPERVVDYRGDRAVVRVVQGDGFTEKEVEVGLSDGLTVVIRAGLNETDEVLERVW